MRRALVGVLALGVALAFSLAVYSMLPERIPIHWTARFEVDDYAPKIVALIIPFATLLIFPLLASILPAVDPRRNFHKHVGTYWIVWNAVMVFFAIVEFMIVGTGLGWTINMAVTVPLLIGGLFIVLGNVLARVRPNWFIGIRTPWTLSSDEVWRRTHRLGAKTMVAAGVVVALTAAFPGGWPKVVPVIGAVVLAAGVPLVYSYLEWRRLGRPEHPAA